MSYGTVEGVASYARTWTRGGQFYDASEYPSVSPTKPTLSEVENWLSEISGAFDLALENEGFVVPVTSAIAPNSYKQLTMKVETLTADLCAYANGLGRLYTDRALERGSLTIGNQEINDWVKNHITGLVNDGVPRSLPQNESRGGFSVSPQRRGPNV